EDPAPAFSGHDHSVLARARRTGQRKSHARASRSVGIAPASLARGSCALGADLEAGEPGHGESGVREDLADRELVVARVVLFEQCDLLEERAKASFDDLRQGSLGLAFVPAD